MMPSEGSLLRESSQQALPKKERSSAERCLLQRSRLMQTVRSLGQANFNLRSFFSLSLSEQLSRLQDSGPHRGRPPNEWLCRSVLGVRLPKCLENEESPLEETLLRNH